MWPLPSAKAALVPAQHQVTLYHTPSHHTCVCMHSSTQEDTACQEPIPIAIGSRTGSSSSGGGKLNPERMGTVSSLGQHSIGSPHAGSRPPSKASSHLLHHPAHFCLNGGDQAEEDEEDSELQHHQMLQQQRWRSIPLPLFPAQPQRSSRSGPQAGSAASSASSSSHCPPPSAPAKPAQGPASAPLERRHPVPGGSSSCSQMLLQRSVPPTKTASFNHNLRNGRREEMYVRNSCDFDQDQGPEDPDGNSSDDAAEVSAPPLLLLNCCVGQQCAVPNIVSDGSPYSAGTSRCICLQ